MWYETKKDLSNEVAVVERIVNALPEFEFQKISVEPHSYACDYRVFKGGRYVANAEIKCRTVRHDCYDTYLLSTKKVLHGSDHGMKLMLVVQWTDRLGYLEITETDMPSFTCVIGGRRDRNNPNDIESVFLIPISRFTFL